MTVEEKKKKTRPQQWVDACTRAQNAKSELISALEELKALQDEYEETKDNIPDNLQSGAYYEKLEAICDLDISETISNIEETDIDSFDGVDLPLGFGRD